MDKPRNQHRRQIADFIASDYFLLVMVAIGVIAVISHQWSMYAGQ